MPAPLGRLRVRAALSRLVAAPHTEGALAACDLFGRELDEYAEIIVGRGGRPAGFMTRGETAGFTERAGATLERLGMPEEALAHHRELAAWFEHVRAFLKLEWHEGEDGQLSPLAACYFRRRPEVDEVLGRLLRFGVAAPARELVMDLASILGKDTVHFVSAAFRPGSEPHHKLYFSQWVTPETRERVAERLARVALFFGLSDEQVARFQVGHERVGPRQEGTLYVSTSFTRDAVSPSFKIDYPDVGPVRAATWLSDADQVSAIREAELCCELAGTPTVSYLGVRLSPDEGAPRLKFYCDVPSPAP